MKRTFFSVCALLCSVSVCFGVFSGGSGSSQDPYRVADATDLAFLAAHSEYFSDDFILTADIDLDQLDGLLYIIGKDTNPTNTSFDGTTFRGTFNGNYHVVRNMTIDARAGGEDYLGLFGAVDSGAEIFNLGVEDAQILCGDTSTDVGLLAGFNGGDVQRCFAAGSIACGTNTIRVGGLIGYNGYPVINCHVDTDITAAGTCQFVGGFVGYNLSYMMNCYACGSVPSVSNFGGFAGTGLSYMFMNCCFLGAADGGGPVNGFATALTDTQMRQQSSFTSWDFFGEVSNGTDEVWMMGGYPVLNWQVPAGLREMAVMSQYWLDTNCTKGQLCGTVDWYADGIMDEKDLLVLLQWWLSPQVAFVYPNSSDDFETGDFSALPWNNDGWTIETDPAKVFEGSYCARATGEGNHELILTLDTTDMLALHFVWKTSTRENYDEMRFYIDGSMRMFGCWGENDWTDTGFTVSDGEHTFKWVYDRNSATPAGEDTVWIDNVRLIPE